jgi:hypothetical protein
VCFEQCRDGAFLLWKVSSGHDMWGGGGGGGVAVVWGGGEWQWLKHGSWLRHGSG